MMPASPDQATGLLNSWKEISDYLGRGVRTVQRWEHDFGLPVRRPGGKMRGSVIALRADLDSWLGHRVYREPESPVCPKCEKLRQEVQSLQARLRSLEVGPTEQDHTNGTAVHSGLA